MRQIDATGLAQAALAAAAEFYARIVPQLAGLAEDATILFVPADHTHAAWRLAAVQELARTAAPHRVNAIAGTQPHEIAQALAFLATAPGVTGQIFVLAGNRNDLV